MTTRTTLSSSSYWIRSRLRRIIFAGAVIGLLLSALLHATTQNPVDVPTYSAAPNELHVIPPLQPLTSTVATVDAAAAAAAATKHPKTHAPPDCPSPRLFPVQDTIVEHSSNYNHKNNGTTTTSHTMIPPVIHATSRVRCMTSKYLAVFDKWRGIPDHSVLLYDDTDIHQHFQTAAAAANNNNNNDSSLTVFPSLSQAMSCLPQHNGASTADLWRYLVLWDQGGVYTDIDNGPGRDLAGLLKSIQRQPTPQDDSTTTTSSTNLDAIIPINQKGRLSQSFLIAAPHHPLMYLALSMALDNLLQLSNLATQDASQVSGPFVLMAAMDRFQDVATPYHKYTAGTYRLSPQLQQSLQHQFPGQSWMINRTVTVVGDKRDPYRYVRTMLKGNAKKEYYKLVQMQQWQTVKKNGTQHEWTGSCQSWLEQQQQQQQQKGDS